MPLTARTILALSILSVSALAQDSSLKSISNPGGGQIIYGPVNGVTSMPQAMGAVLRYVHTTFGDRPQIGKFFQPKDGSSVATFFTLNAKTQTGTKKISGLVIIALPRGNNQPAAAVLFDDPAHFPKTERAMMKTLNEAWHKDGTIAASQPAAANSPAAPAPSGGPVSLRQATAGDRSASIGLAPGWQITSVAGGHLSAEGPNGELIDIGGMFQGIRDPRSMNQPGPYAPRSNAPVLVAPRDGDLFSSYVSIVNQVRQSRGKPPANFRLISSQKVPPQALQAIFEADLHDGKGMRKGSVRLDPILPRNMSNWAMTVTVTDAPVTVFEAQNPVMMAMYKSYSQDRAVIGREQQAVIDRIHATGARAAEQAKDADARRIASSNTFNQHMDNIDRSSKAFQNYQFDSSQLQDNYNNTRGTIDNFAADALVRSDPDRFQIITRPDFIRGLDY